MKSEYLHTFTKTWTRPRFKVYVPAEKKPTVGWNKYGGVNGREGVTIGVYAVLFGRCWAVGWAKANVRREKIR